MNCCLDEASTKIIHLAEDRSIYRGTLLKIQETIFTLHIWY